MLLAAPLQPDQGAHCAIQRWASPHRAPLHFGARARAAASQWRRRPEMPPLRGPAERPQGVWHGSQRRALCRAVRRAAACSPACCVAALQTRRAAQAGPHLQRSLPGALPHWGGCHARCESHGCPRYCPVRLHASLPCACLEPQKCAGSSKATCSVCRWSSAAPTKASCHRKQPHCSALKLW